MNKITRIPQRPIVFLALFLAALQWVLPPDISVASSKHRSEQHDPQIHHPFNEIPSQPDRSLFVVGEILVGFHKDQSSLASPSARANLRALETLDMRGFDGESGDAGVAGFRLSVPPGAEWATIQRLLQDPTIAFATPNWIVRATQYSVKPDDVKPYDDKQYDMGNYSGTQYDASQSVRAELEPALHINDALYEEHQWYLQRIQASRAWILAQDSTLALSPVRVAIIDSGVDFDHPDLQHLREEGRLLDGYNYVTPVAEARDDYGHGTHIAGLIGAALNNEVGIAGLASHVILDPRKVLNQFGGGTISNVAQAIRDATDTGAQIINLSLEASEPNPNLQAAIAYAHSQGVLLISSSGNAGTDQVRWPSAYPEVIAVAATDYQDLWAAYSNYGAEIEIAAPGGIHSQNPIYSTWASGVKCRDTNTLPGGSGTYCSSVGTSMSAALVTGVASLVWGLRPELSASEVRTILQETAVPLTQDATYIGHGRINAYDAVRHALRSDLHISPNQLRVETQTTLSGDSAIPPLRFKLENPALESLVWSVETPPGFVVAGPSGGTIRHGQPARFTLNPPSDLVEAGFYQGDLRFKGTRVDGTQIVQPISIQLFGPNAHHLYLPKVFSERAVSAAATEAIPYQWETPGEAPRNLHILTDNSSISIQLPFYFPLKGALYNAARISSDGFLSFPDGDTEVNHPNRCLADTQWPHQAIYGWWADLDPSRNSESQVTSFQPASDRFVVEFSKVETAAGITPAYQVSFQMVLYQDGQVSLNYSETPAIEQPSQAAPLAHVTIGVEATDGRFYNQITCIHESTELGIMPSSGQSIRIEPIDIY